MMTARHPPRRGWQGTALPAQLMLVALVIPIVLGIIALVRRRGRRCNAVIGISVPALLLLLLGPMFGWRSLLPSTYVWRPQCLSKVHQLGSAFLTHAVDYEGVLPAAEHWPEVLLPYMYTTDLLICPADSRREKQKSGEMETSYTMSSAMSGVNIAQLATPEEIGLLFDGTQLFGGHEAAAFRHNEGLNVATADGGAGRCSRDDFERLRLEP